MSDISRIYDAAERRMDPAIRALGTAHPAYQEEIRERVNAVQRDLALAGSDEDRRRILDAR